MNLKNVSRKRNLKNLINKNKFKKQIKPAISPKHISKTPHFLPSASGETTSKRKYPKQVF